MNRYAIAAALAIVVSAGTTPATSQANGKVTAATAVFAAGCFWCVEEAFDKVEGVLTTTSGYTGGRTQNPSYDAVSSGGTGHTEALRVTYDPATVSYERLLQTFWQNVDAVDGGGQFCDRGDQYRPAIFYDSDDEQQRAEASKARIATQLGQAVAVQIAAADTFYDAEDYHQDYYKKNPIRYKFYKWNCGRAQRLEALWGKSR